MREILFRGKRSHNGEWVYGNLVVDAYGRSHIVPNAFFTEDGHHLRYEDDTDKPVFFNPETLGQFTGLYDRNGVRIFEGDIVKEIFEGTRSASDDYTYVDEDFYGYKIGRVSFTGTGTFIIAQYGELRVNGEKVDSYTPSKRKRIAAYRSEVIGNIYDNPELLKEGSE